jgi:hypothetical protein
MRNCVRAIGLQLIKVAKKTTGCLEPTSSVAATPEPPLPAEDSPVCSGTPIPQTAFKPHFTIDQIDNLVAYLQQCGNHPEDILKGLRLLAFPRVILEIGCGSAETATAIAVRNPGIAVIATDGYPLDGAADPASHYSNVSRKWEQRTLGPQIAPLDNLVLLRAESEMLSWLPDGSLDSILLVNPEPRVGRAFLGFVLKTGAIRKIMPGPHRIVIKPFSREMGMMACGGLEFDHEADWSRGLGFMMECRLKFEKADRVQWDVDLNASSPYSGNSTQTDVYIWGARNSSSQGGRSMAARPHPHDNCGFSAARV